MASSSSDESSRAPENFQVSSASNDEDDIVERNTSAGRIRVPAADSESAVAGRLKCPLCRTSRQKFLCRNCVKNGNIVHSAFQQFPHTESLDAKQQRLFKVHASLKDFSSRYDRLIKEQKASENIRFDVKRKKEEIALLAQLHTEKRTRLQTLTTHRDRLRRINEEKRKHLPKYPIKVKELEDTVLDHKAKIDGLYEVRQQMLVSLQEMRQHNIHELVRYVFPISEMMLKDERRSSDEAAVQSARTIEDSETIAALADAKNTSYIRGKWVIHGSGISEMQYRIVAPSLPANGDYTAYTDWLAENKDDVPRSTSNEVAPSRVTAFRIVGALTYTTQLTQLLAYYLNVRLPFKSAYGDFCKKLNEKQFLRKVSCLNSNIMYLAYTQQVQLRTLNENHTLENILTILDVEKSLLGRDGYHEVSNAPLQKSIDSVLIGIETATESEGEDEQSLDWETLPSLATPQEIIGSHMSAPAAQQPTIAHGLMTSLRYFAGMMKPKRENE